MNYDYFIIGQGIAGTVLGLTLEEQNQSVKLFDIPNDGSSSRVAAGLINAVTGKNLVLTWLADETFSALHQFYPAMEKKLNTTFFHPHKIYKPFKSVYESNHIFGKSNPEELGDYVETNVDNAPYKKYTYNDLGGFYIQKGGYVHTINFLDAAKKYWLQKGAYQESIIDYESIELIENGVKIGNDFAKRIIFCEGIAALRNPFFQNLELIPVKGEVFTLKIEDMDCPNILNRNGWVIPLGNNLFRAGATYQLKFDDNQPTDEGKAELIEKMDDLLKLPYTIVGHKAGLRPTTRTRRPFIGIHARYEQIGIFNGLGSKGVSLAPYFAQLFVDNLLFEKEIPKEVRLNPSFSL